MTWIIITLVPLYRTFVCTVNWEASSSRVEVDSSRFVWMMMLLAFTRILILESFDVDIGGSGESVEGGISLLLLSLLLDRLTGAMEAFRWTSISLVKELTTALELVRVQCVCPLEDTKTCCYYWLFEVLWCIIGSFFGFMDGESCCFYWRLGWVGDGREDCNVGMKVYVCIVSGVLGLSGEDRFIIVGGGRGGVWTRVKVGIFGLVSTQW